MGLSWDSYSTLIYTSKLILCSTICVHSATRHNIIFIWYDSSWIRRSEAGDEAKRETMRTRARTKTRSWQGMIKSAWATVSTCVMLSTTTATSACAPTSTCMRVHEYVGDAEHNRELKVYIKDFFARLNLPNVLKSMAKKKFWIAIFLPRVFMYQKRQISLPVAFKTARPKPGDWERLWYHFRTPSFAKNRFLRHFLFSYKQRTIVPFLSELISSQ